MSNISKGIQDSTLQNTSDWYLSLQALKDANDAIIKMKNGLDLPEIHRNDPNELHTASDEQKILIRSTLHFRTNTLALTKHRWPIRQLTNVLPCFTRLSLWHRQEKRLVWVDMYSGGVPLNNPVIKSTIHSTDTQGSTEVFFGMMHLLGVFFAPRIKDLGSQQLYGFISKKEYAELDYKEIPNHTINTALIENHWDDFLRGHR